MEIESYEKVYDVLKRSPVRQYLKLKNGMTLYDGEVERLKDIEKIIISNLESLQKPLTVVILGEVKAGKSTLVNAILQKKIAYSDVLEATAAIMEIQYSPEEEVTILKKDGDVKSLSLYNLNNLIEANRDNQMFFDNIEKIKVFTNSENLKDIILVDTPGLNTSTSENSMRTYNYISQSDIVLWVINSCHMGQRDVIEDIETIMDLGKPIIGVFNRIDEIDGSKEELLEYVEGEMGYMFKEIFAISALRAWEGFEEKDDLKIQESNISELCDYIINNIEKKSEEVQVLTTDESMNTQVSREIHVHKEIEKRLLRIVDDFGVINSEFNEADMRIKNIIDNKLNHWVDVEFFERERGVLYSAKNKVEFDKLIEKYKTKDYLNNIITNKYEQLNEYVFHEWSTRNEEILNKVNCDSINIRDVENVACVKQFNSENDTSVIEGIKNGGIAASAVGVGLAGYAAWLGPAAAYVTIGNALAAFCPPLLIAGAIGGGVWSSINENKNKNIILNGTDEFMENIKLYIREKVINEMKSKLYGVSEQYMHSSICNMMSILKQCNTSLEDERNIIPEIKEYVVELEKLI